MAGRPLGLCLGLLLGTTRAAAAAPPAAPLHRTLGFAREAFGPGDNVAAAAQNGTDTDADTDTDTDTADMAEASGAGAAISVGDADAASASASSALAASGAASGEALPSAQAVVKGAILSAGNATTSAGAVAATAAGGGGDSTVAASPYWVGLDVRSREIFDFDPKGRRGHSSTMYLASDGNAAEAMLVSGGFTDQDWKSFPLYAFRPDGALTYGEYAGTGLWTDLSDLIPPPDSSALRSCLQSTVRADTPDADTVDDQGDPVDLWSYAMECPPPPRMSHYTTVHDGHVYVFGGLLYNEHTGLFSQEERDFVYRVNLKGLLNRDDPAPATGWQRILPRISTPPRSITSQIPSGPRRGEMRGGHWRAQEKVVVFGGLRVHDLPADAVSNGRQVDTPLSDVWSYDLKLDTWERIISNANGASVNQYPQARTAHAADVAGDHLIVYGGLSKIGEDMWMGATTWSGLSDVWIFDLIQRRWEQRYMLPRLSRAYHGIVAWEESDGERMTPTFAVFGGSSTVVDEFTEETYTFVFNDLLVSRASVLTPTQTAQDICFWQKAMTDPNLDSDADHVDDIMGRSEHSTALSRKNGMMYVWGGQFRTTSGVDDGLVWAINIADPKSNVRLELAEPDNTEEGKEEDAEQILSLFFLSSMILTTMCSILSHRRQEISDDDDYGDDGDPGTRARQTRNRNGGLQQDVINTIPLTTYADKIEDGTASESSTICEETGAGLEENPAEECCSICLVEWERGDRLRCLPCGHEFHQSCIDPWLSTHSSCPECRHDLRSLEETVALSRSDNERLLPSIFGRLLRNATSETNGVTMNIVSAESISSLELREVTTSPFDGDDNTGDRRSRLVPQSSPLSSDSSVSSRSRTRRVRRGRRRGGRNMAGRRVPLTEYEQADTGATIV